jgi:hypothetical protein
MFYRFLADAVLAFHVGYALFVVVGLAAILLGGALGWRWVHNRWFRAIHFLMIAVVAFEAMINMTCPLTHLENYFRALGGEAAETGSFVGRLLHSALFLEWMPQLSDGLLLNALHVAFAVLVLGAFWVVPVHWRRKDDPARGGASREGPAAWQAGRPAAKITP